MARRRQTLIRTGKGLVTAKIDKRAGSSRVGFPKDGAGSSDDLAGRHCLNGVGQGGVLESAMVR